MMVKCILLLLIAVIAASAEAFGPSGHRLVGAIADVNLADDPTVAAKVASLLDGLTLRDVATLPDEIKSWDACGKKHGPSNAPVTGRTRLNDELRAFVAANPCDGTPSHHEFHYTDVPVAGNERYASGPVGRSEFDIVHMIPFCVHVLTGKIPEDNERKITKSVAVILLAHYLGDIHQPLHVGAEYFDAAGRPVEPASDEYFADQGGNKLTLFTLVRGQEKSAGKFHGYWDSQTVTNAFSGRTDSSVAKDLGRREPDDWKLSGDADTWAEQMADEILPVAREAHERLQYRSVKTKHGARDISSGKAVERRQRGGTYYAVWAYRQIKGEVHKAGWRLAALLEAALR
jgi:hypothetical protein